MTYNILSKIFSAYIFIADFSFCTAKITAFITKKFHFRENKDTQGKMAAVYLDLEGIRSTVESQDTAMQGIAGSVSTLTQSSDSLKLELESMRQNGTGKVKTNVGYTFDDKGLQITRSDSDMANLLDHTGMYVRRNGQTLLQANNQGVQARDVSVGNYLIIGDNARIEDYSGDRTACFYIG